MSSWLHMVLSYPEDNCLVLGTSRTWPLWLPIALPRPLPQWFLSLWNRGVRYMSIFIFKFYKARWTEEFFSTSCHRDIEKKRLKDLSGHSLLQGSGYDKHNMIKTQQWVTTILTLHDYCSLAVRNFLNPVGYTCLWFIGQRGPRGIPNNTGYYH